VLREKILLYLINVSFISASIDNGFVLLRNALCSDKWKTAIVLPGVIRKFWDLFYSIADPSCQ